MNIQHLLQSMWGDVEKLLADDNNASMERRRNAGEFHYIPYALDRFVEQLHHATIAASLSRTPGSTVKFIDAGCGIGSKVLAAHRMSAYDPRVEAYGIEKEPKYVKAARNLLGVSLGKKIAEERIISGDAIRHNYGPYDIIYFYRPLCDPDKQVKLEERIVSTCKKDTIIIANGPQSHHFRPMKDEKPTGKLRDVHDHTIFIRI